MVASQVSRAGVLYRRAHSAILLARALRGAAVVEAVPAVAGPWSPVTTLALRVLPDLRAVEALMERSADLAAEGHLDLAG